MGSPCKNLLLITVLLHMATVTMEANDFLHSNATDKGRKRFFMLSAIFSELIFYRMITLRQSMDVSFV